MAFCKEEIELEKPLSVEDVKIAAALLKAKEANHLRIAKMILKEANSQPVRTMCQELKKIIANQLDVEEDLDIVSTYSELLLIK